MYLGRVVEEGSRDDVLKNPKHPYTQALLAAVPKMDTETRQETVRLEGELPSPANPPKGCHFHQRCPHVMPKCREHYPDLSQLSRSHTVKCFLYEEDYHGSTDSN
jgi:peptide/nickel transport system ATP-binding protein